MFLREQMMRRILVRRFEQTNDERRVFCGVFARTNDESEEFEQTLFLDVLT